MKVRKLAVALALAGGLGSGVAQALGLGEIELQSYLNEPLEADINLRKSQGVDPDDVFVNIASENDYQRVGIDRNHFLTKLQFEVTTSSDGNLIVNVSSREPLREPYLNFLLEVTWPSGRLMREYSVLVDPPVYAEESGLQEQVTAPSTRQVSAPETSTGTAPRTDRRPAPQSTGSPRTFGPTGSSDTLWKIAQSVRPNDSVSMQQVMLAIQDLNPDAFMGDNINRLKRGEVLRIPDLDQIQSRSRAEANRQVAVQNDEFSSPTRTVDATEAATPTPETEVAGSESAGGDELRLITADETGGRDSEEGGSAGGGGQTAGGVDAGSAVAMEELESARRENEELNTRVADLQDQVETLQRLLELKNSQLADMQQMTGEDDAAAADQEADDSAMEEESMAAGDLSSDQGGGEQPAEVSPDVAGDPSASSDVPDAGDGAGETGDVGEVGAGEEVADSDTDMAVAEDSEAGDDEEMIASDESGMTAQEPPSAAADGEAPQSETQPSASPSDPAAPAQQSAKGFPANVIDAITNNTLYQIALGGGLILLLLLLLLLARRSANREKAFYDELNGEEGESDSFDLSLDDESAGEASADDSMAEAETYIAYGQTDKAVQVLETAISREPSRTDLRLMLLGVYADAQNRDSFDKQFREIEALEDDSAISEAGALRERLEDAEATPSIDDLESQLRSDSFEQNVESRNDQAESSQPEQPEDELEDLDVDFSDLEIADSGEEDSAVKESKDEAEPDSDMIEYDLSGLEESADDSASDFETSEAEEALDFDIEKSDEDSSDDLADELSLEDFESLETDFTAGDSSEQAEQAEQTASLEESAEEKEPEGEGLGDLDESFLDELDAELDKVAGESEDDESLTSEESGLDDLELDVSDEDLALMEEFADSEDTDTPEPPESASELDEELDLEDSLMDKGGETPEDLVSAEENPETVEGQKDELPDLGEADKAATPEEPPVESDIEPPVASDSLDSAAKKTAVDDIDESDLGEDDEFDFLAGTDEAATKLDLARAYIEMGDMDGARDILEEVALEGDDEQKVEAQDLLKNLS